MLFTLPKVALALTLPPLHLLQFWRPCLLKTAEDWVANAQESSPTIHSLSDVEHEKPDQWWLGQ